MRRDNQIKKRTFHTIPALFILGIFTILVVAWNASPAPLHTSTPKWPSELIASPVGQTCSTKLPTKDTCGEEITPGCTVFTVSKGGQVFFGGNDDYIHPDSYYWVDPGGAQRYGAIWVGTPDNVQQGVNEKGLAYDANGLPRVDTNPHWEREPVSGGYSSYPLHILHECATVEEVIEWVNTHQWHSYMHDQMQFADASGDAVIISAGSDGEVVFTRKPPGDGFLVSTNFNVANPSNGDYPCQRYETATRRLSELLKREGELTAQDATAVLDAVHVEGGSSWTIESLVADLPNGIVYLYYFYQYDRPIVLDVTEEIAKARAPGPLSELFPEEVRQEAASRFQRILSKQANCPRIGKVWVGLVLASLVLLVVFSIRNPRGLILWLPVTILLGPLGLLIWLVAGRKQTSSSWQAALVEAVGHVSTIAFAYMVMLAVFILAPQAQSNVPAQILFIFLLPLLLGLSLFQGPLLALATRRSYLHMLSERLPVAWIAANLGMGGISPVALRLVHWISNNCSVIDPPVWTVVSLWTAVVAGAILAYLLILLYESWAVRRGYRAWSVLAYGGGEVTTPSWRELWWWILLSFVVLIGGFLLD